MNTRKAIDAIVLVVGIWLVLSSVFLFSPEYLEPMWGGILLGLAVIGFAIWGEFNTSSKAPELINALLGIVLFLSPWLLSFSEFVPAAWNARIFGIVLVVLEMFAFQGGMMERTPHQPA